MSATTNYKGCKSGVVEIECVFFGPLREAVGQKTVHFETSANTAGDLLAELQASYPDMRELVDDGELADGIAVTHNGTHLPHRDGLATALEDGDLIRLTTAVYGG